MAGQPKYFLRNIDKLEQFKVRLERNGWEYRGGQHGNMWTMQWYGKGSRYYDRFLSVTAYHQTGRFKAVLLADGTKYNKKRKEKK